MQDIQEVFRRVQENRKKLKDLRTAYKDALANVQEYSEIVEKAKTLRERKKQIEGTVKNDFASEFTQMEDIQIDIQSDMELMSDLAMTQLMKGETVQVTDEYDQNYEPTFSVKFKKT